MPGSGTRAERRVVAKKTLMGRAGFYFINVGGLFLKVFLSQDIPTPCNPSFSVFFFPRGAAFLTF